MVRDATASPLWQVVHEFFPKLVDYVGRHDQYVPAFVERELEAFLACGRIDRGFSHIRCMSCDARQLVPLTCKSRAVGGEVGAPINNAEGLQQLVQQIAP